MMQGELLAAGHDPGGKTRIPMPVGWKVEAVFGGDGSCYRYSLSHVWDSTLPMACIVMMNPSTADEHFLDPTVRKTSQIFRLLGYGGQFIANTCAYRATDRMRLLTVADPVGPGNVAAVLNMAEQAELVVIAHGKLPGELQRHATALCGALRAAGHSLRVLALSQDGTPVHPLARGKGHIPITVTPMPWEGGLN